MFKSGDEVLVVATSRQLRGCAVRSELPKGTVWIVDSIASSVLCAYVAAKDEYWSIPFKYLVLYDKAAIEAVDEVLKEVS